MKVILTAFDGLMSSKVLEWPELPPGTDIEFPLRQLSLSWNLYDADKPDIREVVDLRACFRPNGKFYLADDDKAIQEFELIRVSPEHWGKG